MRKHTPGPWFAHNILMGKRGKGPFAYPLGSDPEQAAANAYLIAAAPDMLAALELYFSDFKRFHKAASDAIAKARGEG